jgi:hypothetical protein
MREIQVLKWCDICFQEANKEDGLFIDRTPAIGTFTLGCVEGEGMRPTPKAIDVCEVHAKQFRDLIIILRESGQLPEPPPAPPTKSNNGDPMVTCPVCSERVTRNSLLPHVWGVHRHGEKRPKAPAICPECKEKYQPQGMSLHRKANHGVDPLFEALSGVKGYHVTGKERDMVEASIR